jgi:hypothetical protein
MSETRRHSRRASSARRLPGNKGPHCSRRSSLASSYCYAATLSGLPSPEFTDNLLPRLLVVMCKAYPKRRRGSVDPRSPQRRSLCHSWIPGTHCGRKSISLHAYVRAHALADDVGSDLGEPCGPIDCQPSGVAVRDGSTGLLSR